VPEIKEFFWKWRRSHHPSAESSLDRWFHNLMREGAKGMSHIGVFGATVAEEMAGLDRDKSEAKSGRRTFAGGMGGGGGMEMEGAGSSAPPRAMLAEAAMPAPANGMSRSTTTSSAP